VCVAARSVAVCEWIARRAGLFIVLVFSGSFRVMAKPHRIPKKANHGKRPANSKGRKTRRQKVRT
jgi:hypothetical protein